MKHPALSVILLAATTCIVTAGSSSAFAQGRGPISVVVSTVTERDVSATLRLVGTIMAEKESIVASEVSGAIVSFDVQEGQFLKQHDAIAQVSPEVARLRLAEAQARLQSLQARLQELVNGTRPEELRRSQAAVDEAQAIKEKWEFERARVKRLFEMNQTSDKQSSDTEKEYTAASRRLDQAAAELEIAQNGPRAEVIAQARFDVASQTAIVARLQRDFDKTTLRAPFDGFVVKKRTEVGQWIDAGGPVCEMVAVETVKVRIDVPESAIRFAKPGSVAAVSVVALDKSYKAVVSRVVPRAAAAARTFPIEIDLPNADHALLPGMFVWARVASGPPGKRLMVTKDAIVSQGERKQIFVLRPGENGATMAMPVSVRTGVEVGDEVEILTKQVRAGDRVVCRGNENLHGPTAVIATPSAASQPAKPAAADADSKPHGA